MGELLLLGKPSLQLDLQLLPVHLLVMVQVVLLLLGELSLLVDLLLVVAMLMVMDIAVLLAPTQDMPSVMLMLDSPLVLLLLTLVSALSPHLLLSAVVFQ